MISKSPASCSTSTYDSAMLLDSMVDFALLLFFAVSSAACAGDAPLAAGEEDGSLTRAASLFGETLAHESATVGEVFLSRENSHLQELFHEDKAATRDKEGEERCHCNKLHEAAVAA